MLVGVSSVTLSLPCVVGGTGVLQTFPLPLSTEENVRLSEGAMIIRGALDELEI
jgi:malate/lactate dehydrogenase